MIYGGLLVLGSLCSGAAWVQWARAERAIRRGEPLPSVPIALVVCVGVVPVALIRAGGGIGVRADQGMSAERTSISWERTALAAVTGVLVVARLNLEHLTPLALTSLAVTLGATLGVVVARPCPDGRRPALVALAVFGLAASELRRRDDATASGAAGPRR